MSAPVPFTMSGAFSGAPMSAVPASASWFYVTIQDVTGQSTGLMSIATKTADLMSVRGRSSGLLSIRQR